MAEAQSMYLQQEHQAHSIVRQRCAHATRVALDEILLQLRQVGVGNAVRAEATESGSDTVERLVGLQGFPFEIFTALHHALTGFVRQGQASLVRQDFLYDVKGQRTLAYFKCLHLNDM